jgi:NTE family protein
MKRLNLALQGGGAHGAFTWGVLDALLEDDRFVIAAITATSAGTMNALVCADGMRRDGRAGGRRALEGFWYSIAHARAAFSPVSMNAVRKALDPFGVFKSKAFQWFDILTSVASPYEFNPWNFNPLKDKLLDAVDFDALRANPPFELFVSATNVHTGKARVFRTADMRVEVALASACLPYLFQAVEIDGAAWWDGGYVANPALWPLFYEDLPRDVLICCINPGAREATPKTSAEIMDRLNEITFSASLTAELRAIAFVQKLLDENALHPDAHERYRRVLVHAIRADDALGGLGVETKFDTSWPFLTDLRDKGRAAYQAWASAHGDAVGDRGSVDIRADYLDG